MRGLLVSCYKGRETVCCGWHGIQLQRMLCVQRTHISKCFQNGERPQVVKHRITISPSNSTLRYRPKRPKTGVQTNPRIWIVMSTNKGMDGPRNAMWLSNEKEPSTDILYRANDPWKYDAEWKQPDLWFHKMPTTGKSMHTERWTAATGWGRGIPWVIS